MEGLNGSIDVLGFGAFVLAAAGLMLRYILRRSEKQAEDYKRIVENHLLHSTEAIIDLKHAIGSLAETNRELIVVVKELKSV